MGAVGGISVQIGLPALSAMLDSHGTALAQGGALPKRFLVWFWANGVKPARWVPSSVGPDWALSEQLTPLKNVKEYVSVVSGTEIKFPNAAHHTGAISMMTGADIVGPEGGGDFPTTVSAPSMDQRFANALGTTTRFKSLEFGVLEHNAIKESDGILNISHNGKSSPNPAEIDARKVFDRVFGTGFTAPSTAPNPNPAPADISLGLRKSVLDGVLADMEALKPRLGTDDLNRLAQHAENIRGIERATGPLHSQSVHRPAEYC